ADDPKANSNSTNKTFLAVFVCALGSGSTADTFTLIGPRALVAPGDIIHFPAFSDYDPALTPGTLVFASALNFNPDGTFPTTHSDGLNPSNVTQIFSTQASPSSTSALTFTRLTNSP